MAALRVSADGLRVLGEWPPRDSATLQQALVAVLLQIADELPEEEARPVRRAAGGIASFAQGVVADATEGQLKRLGREALGWASGSGATSPRSDSCKTTRPTRAF